MPIMIEWLIIPAKDFYSHEPNEPAHVHIDRATTIHEYLVLRIGLISVGAAFQPRLSDYGLRATSFRSCPRESESRSCQQSIYIVFLPINDGRSLL